MIRSILFVAVVISLLWIGFSGIVSDGVPVQANKADQQQTVKKGICRDRLKRLLKRLEPRDPTKLYGRQLEIASGKTDLPAWKVWCYREKWEKQGKQLPEWVNGPKEFPGRTIVLREGEVPPMACEEVRSWVENGVTYKEYNCGECDCCEQPVLTCSELFSLDYESLPQEVTMTIDGGCFDGMSVTLHLLYPHQYPDAGLIYDSSQIHYINYTIDGEGQPADSAPDGCDDWPFAEIFASFTLSNL